MPAVLAVGVNDDVASLCSVAAGDADVGFVRVAHGPAACRAIASLSPTVVAIGAHLWADERNAVAKVARENGARVIELPHVAPATWQALLLIRAAIGVGEALSATG